MEVERNRIRPLEELDDYEVADGDPDVRGWDVVASDGTRIGRVDQLLVDAQAMKVRYLDVDLDDKLVSASDQDLHVLLPIGVARLDRNDKRVRFDALPANEVRGLPRYAHGTVTRDYELTLRNRFARDSHASSEDFYTHDIYDDQRFYMR